MNGFERITAVLNGEKHDKVPFMPHNFMMAVDEFGISMKQFRENSEKIADVFERSVYKYRLDGIVVDVDTAVLAEAIGVEVDFPMYEPARTKGSLLQSANKLHCLPKVELSQKNRVNIILEAVRILRHRLGNDVYIRGNCDQAPFTLASLVRGLDNWMMDILCEEEEYIHGLLNYCTDVTCQYVSLMAQAGADMISNGDSSAGCSLISPQLYEKYALPYEIIVVEKTHSLNKPYMLHICGETDKILHLMKKTKADALELDYKTDIHLIHNLLKDDTVFSGNIDPVSIIRFGTSEEVSYKTREIFDLYSDSNRFILNAGCAIVKNTPPENILAMCNYLESRGSNNDIR